MNFQEINQNRFPVTKILNILPEKSSLFENVLVSSNDKLVELFQQKLNLQIFKKFYSN